MAVALRISSETSPAIRLYQVIQAVVPLTDGLTKPLNCFQGTPLSILKNWLYNNLSLLVPSTLPVKTNEDQCWGGWEGPHSSSALPKKGTSCQASQTETTTDPQGSLRTSRVGLQLLPPEAGEDGKEMSLRQWSQCEGLQYKR